MNRGGAEAQRTRRRTTEWSPPRPPRLRGSSSCRAPRLSYRDEPRFAADFRDDDFLADDFLADVFRPDDFRAEDFFALERFAVDFFADDLRAEPFRADDFFADERLRGTFAPFARASERPIAIACSRLFTRPPCPALPRLSVPDFRRFMALFTLLPAARPYLRPPDLFVAIAPPM